MTTNIPDYTEIDPATSLLTPKELAYYLRKHVTYVYKMTQRGFPMAAGLATLDSAQEWLRNNPGFRRDG